jgi:hypothetical protein
LQLLLQEGAGFQ